MLTRKRAFHVKRYAAFSSRHKVQNIYKLEIQVWKPRAATTSHSMSLCLEFISITGAGKCNSEIIILIGLFLRRQ